MRERNRGQPPMTPGDIAPATGKAPVACAFTVTGRVQGVGFRQATRKKAVELAVQGWVENAADGSVRGAAMGAPDAMDRFLRWLRQGPPPARVDDLQIVPREVALPPGFEIRR